MSNFFLYIPGPRQSDVQNNQSKGAALNLVNYDDSIRITRIFVGVYFDLKKVNRMYYDKMASPDTKKMYLLWFGRWERNVERESESERSRERCLSWNSGRESCDTVSASIRPNDNVIHPRRRRQLWIGSLWIRIEGHRILITQAYSWSSPFTRRHLWGGGGEMLILRGPLAAGLRIECYI